ncbi:NADPH-dependent FMN reductase [Salinispora sp. H7-4]|uniref:NADPH-dependent FMN reductase n=1 Tax=Salinispora sp. H7-4 TaxID=2748321 RepID=UPI0003614A24|nr:NAD(P)H-dependent oxidoreductase [Salinispora sp. H7-4]NYT95799.1 NAD(P)H-dependent oxidoreductase [Salinispora sp. H7-4]
MHVLQLTNTSNGTSRVRNRTGPLIVGIGGTMRPGSSTEQAVRAALSAAEQAGARTHLLGATELQLPLYLPGEGRRTAAARQFVNAVRMADGIVIGTPAYHGGISGLVKNALDYIEDLRDAPRPYLHGRAVGCLVTARGSQAATTLTSLRAVVHALRGWPTPLGVAVNTEHVTFAADGTSTDSHVSAQLSLMGEQVVEFALARATAA